MGTVLFNDCLAEIQRVVCRIPCTKASFSLKKLSFFIINTLDLKI
jgi:hypothetical protein